MAFKVMVRAPAILCHHHVGWSQPRSLHRGTRLGLSAWTTWHVVVDATGRQLSRDSEVAFVAGLIQSGRWSEAARGAKENQRLAFLTQYSLPNAQRAPDVHVRAAKRGTSVRPPRRGGRALLTVLPCTVAA